MCHFDPDDCERSLLIPVRNAYPAFQAHFERWRTDHDRPSPEELSELVTLAFRFLIVSTRLMSYVEELGGRSEN